MTRMRKVTLIKGDGIGPEVIESAVRSVEALGLGIEWEEMPAGEKAIKEFGDPLPQETIEAIKRNKVCLKGPLTTPIGKGYRSVNVSLRQNLGLFANIRPAKLFDGVPSPYSGRKIDFIVIRENTEDLYVGIELKPGSKEAKALLEALPTSERRKILQDSAISLKPISYSASKRIAEFAFHYAEQNKRRKVSVVTKANIMKETDGIFLDAARSVASNHELEFEELLVDNAAMQLVKKPESYDVLLCPNLYGDILSDLCAGIVGGLGLVPSANIGEGFAVFEPVHGSAPKHAGKNEANPFASILSAAMMLRYLGELEASEKLEKAVREVIFEGKKLTYDIAKGKPSKTTEVTEEVIKKLRK